MNPKSNPLQAFFRQPAIYIRLPSGGQGWPDGSLDLPENQEIPVYPMTAIDEITYRTPDALFNGEATVAVIRSCVPNIIEPWHMPSSDLDSVLIAIRIASFGHTMNVETQCPECQTDNDFGLDLRTVIDNLKSADYSKPLIIGDLQVFFKPLSYRELTKNSMAQFEQQKTLQMLQDATLSEDQKVQSLNEMMKRVVDLTIDAMAAGISEIRTPNSITQESDFVVEFLHNCDRKVYTQIRDHVVALREQGEIKPLKLKCMNCQHQYDQSFTLDMARFFE